MMVILILLVWRIGFGVMGLKLTGVMLTIQGCCLARCWKSVVNYHPKYKDQFMERPPMKTIQP
jgi:hypothetical protein